MGKKGRQRRKEKVRRIARAESRRRVNNQPTVERHLYLPEYHRFVFAEIEPDVIEAINDATIEPRLSSRTHWSAPERRGTWQGELAWSHLNAYLTRIEQAIRKIVEKHSHYYWLHLYRRIGVGLHSSLVDSGDKVTVHLVRNIMENAFTKYAGIEGRVDDMALSTEVPLEDVAGGLLLRALQNSSDQANDRTRAIKLFSESLARARRWVMLDFGATDYVNVYRLEALAHEYWLTTARMRRVGKGGILSVDEVGDVHSAHDENFESLIRSYDARIEDGRFDTSSIGAGFYSKLRPGDLVGWAAVYNVEKRTWGDICINEEICRDNRDFVTNFLIAPMSLSAYFAAHSFAAAAFERSRGFSLASFCGYIAAVGTDELATAELAESEPQRFVFWKELYQRGYSIHENAGYAERLTGVAVKLMDDWLGPANHRMSEEAALVHEFLTLRAANQQGSGLWSLGPRYVFTEHSFGVVIDLQALTVVLQNAFFGVSCQPEGKGAAFEDTFRAYATEAGLDLLPHRILKNCSGERECDAAVRVGDTLFLCECRAMERPLDFEIGRVQTVERRTIDLQKKVDQVLSLGDFVRQAPRGTNYDFSWAREIVPLVVSPFIEWIWTKDGSAWLNETIPRVLSAREAVTLMRGEAA